MIIDLTGAVGDALVKVPLVSPFSNENYLRVTYMHLPDLPLVDTFATALTVDGVIYDVPQVSSIQELVDPPSHA